MSDNDGKKGNEELRLIVFFRLRLKKRKKMMSIIFFRFNVLDLN